VITLNINADDKRSVAVPIKWLRLARLTQTDYKKYRNLTAFTELAHLLRYIPDLRCLSYELLPSVDDSLLLGKQHKRRDDTCSDEEQLQRASENMLWYIFSAVKSEAIAGRYQQTSDAGRGC
jgi:hypothetical protein